MGRKVREGPVGLIPQVFYDLIGRIVPGTATKNMVRGNPCVLLGRGSLVRTYPPQTSQGRRI